MKARSQLEPSLVVASKNADQFRKLKKKTVYIVLSLNCTTVTSTNITLLSQIPHAAVPHVKQHCPSTPIKQLSVT